MAEADDGLFLIDGEDAGTTPWEFSSVVDDGTCVFDLNDTAEQNGTYGYKALFDGASRNCYATLDLADPSTIYFRGYVKFSAGFAMGSTYENVNLFLLRDGTTDIIVFGAYCHDATELVRWWKISEVDGIAEETDATEFSLNVWHRIEIKFVAGTGSDGIVECKCDGTTLFGAADTGLSTSALAPDTLIVGGYEDRGQEPANGAYMYFDDIKAATGDWVGEYSEAGGGGSSIPAIMQYYRRLRA